MDRLLFVERGVSPEETAKVRAAAKAAKQALTGKEVEPRVHLLPAYAFSLIPRHEYHKLGRVPPRAIRDLSEDETLGIVSETLRQVPGAADDLHVPVKAAGFLTVRKVTFVTFQFEAPQVIRERTKLTDTLDDLNDSAYPSWSAFYPQLPVAVLQLERDHPQTGVYRSDVFEAFNDHRPEDLTFQGAMADFK